MGQWWCVINPHTHTPACEMADVPETLVERAVDLISASSSIVAFTGAGISVDSGIPDLR